MVAKFYIVVKKIEITRSTNSLPHDLGCLKERLATIFVLWLELYNHHLLIVKKLTKFYVRHNYHDLL